MDTRIFVGILILCILGIGASLLKFSGYEPYKSHLNYEEAEQSSLFDMVHYYDQAILPLPLHKAEKTKEVLLGEILFEDREISNNGKSCASCHDLSVAGINPKDQWSASGSSKFNTPGMYNTRFLSKRFWLGKTISAETQVRLNLENGMEISISEVVERVRQIDFYRKEFSNIYPDGITEKNLFKAIIAYQDYLVSISRFDRFLNGDENAISQLEKDGYALFINYGCASCHQGINLGGNMFQKVGIFQDYFKDRAATHDLVYKEIDYGLEQLTGDPADRHIFRVPSLRNVGITSPYLHDGSLVSLEETILVMGKYQVGREIPSGEVAKIEAFLRTLTGEDFDSLQ